MFWNKTSVNILKELDTTDKWWCSSAVMFSVKDGKNVICGKCGPENEDYEFLSQLQINGLPVVQSKMPICSTCKALLATGYGIENIDCPELEAARTCMNSGFISITDSAERIKPLLGLLSDGLYVLADTICFPSDGEGHFFYEIPDEPKYYEAACDGYYSHPDLTCIDHLPLYLYPTQSSSLIDKERVKYYMQLFKSDDELPRALAYHWVGFMNLLLDGHHKACAAASLGQYLRCLTIIPIEGCLFDQTKPFVKGNPYLKSIHFAGLEAEVEDGTRYLDIYGDKKKKENLPGFKPYNLTDTKIHYGPARYPAVKDIATLIYARNKIDGFFPEADYDVISKMLSRDTEEADRYLEAIVNYLGALDHDKAYKLAGDIVRKGDGFMRHLRVRAALMFLLTCRSDETEKLIADFYVDHEEHDGNWELANSYWTENK